MEFEKHVWESDFQENCIKQGKLAFTKSIRAILINVNFSLFIENMFSI
jgi:hypothetical protein